MRTDKLYLVDIVQAAEHVEEILSGVTKEQFMGSITLQGAVMYQLISIGEAAAKVSDELRSRHLGIEWSDIVAFRNNAVHAYFSVDWEIVWVAGTLNVVVLREQIASLLEAEFAGTEADDL